MMGHLNGQHGPAALRRRRRRSGHPPAAATALILLLAAVSLSSSALTAAVGSPLTIPLSRRQRDVKRHRHGEGNGDKSQTTTLTRFEQGAFAFFATLEVPSVAPSNEGEVQVRDLVTA